MQTVFSRRKALAEGLRTVMLEHGYTEVATPGPEVAVVLHFLDPDAARPYRRKAAPTFVVALAELPAAPVDLLRTERDGRSPVLDRALDRAGLAENATQKLVSGDQRGSVAKRGAGRSRSSDAMRVAHSERSRRFGSFCT